MNDKNQDYIDKKIFDSFEAVLKDEIDNNLKCDPPGSKIRIGPYTPIEFMPIPDIYPIYTE